MNFKEAYKAMQEGKKVRREGSGGVELYYNFELDCIYFKEHSYCGRYFLMTVEDCLANDWEVVEEKKKYWQPKYNEAYYEMYNSGIYSDTNLDTSADKFRFSIGNYFKTKIEAEHMAEKLKVIHELQKFAYENNEEEIDWNNVDQCKYMLIYDIQIKEIDTMVSYWKNFNPFNIYFTSYTLALKAIETIGEDRIKKYYFDVEE